MTPPCRFIDGRSTLAHSLTGFQTAHVIADRNRNSFLPQYHNTAGSWPRDAMHKCGIFAVERRLSVRPFVTMRYCSKAA